MKEKKLYAIVAFKDYSGEHRSVYDLPKGLSQFLTDSGTLCPEICFRYDFCLDFLRISTTLKDLRTKLPYWRSVCTKYDVFAFEVEYGRFLKLMDL